MLTRILWLDGLDADNANSKSRYIYIHGTTPGGSPRHSRQPWLRADGQRRHRQNYSRKSPKELS